MKITILNRKHVIGQLKAMEAGFTAANYDAVAKGADMLIAEAKKLIASGYYQPAIDTGRLYDSLRRRIIIRKKGIRAEIYSLAFYNVFVELGTVNMDPRPFMIDALRLNLDKLARNFASSYKAVIL